jgi:hypothetical protein
VAEDIHEHDAYRSSDHPRHGQRRQPNQGAKQEGERAADEQASASQALAGLATRNQQIVWIQPV